MTPHDDPPAQIGAEKLGMPKRQRIAKLMARAGLCSRRDAEAWIVDGRVSVNGTLISSPALDVADDDAILVDGTPIPSAEKTRLFLFHKPRGLVTSDHDPEGRETVADYLRAHWPEGPRVVTIGRLDINTEGLLLLTNDGGLARMLELPQTGWVRRYRVRAKGMTDPGTLDALAAGVTIDGIDYAGIEAKLDRVQGANCWLTMGLREGKNREVKRVLEHIGLEVNRLIRLSFGPFQLLELPEGAVEEVRTRVLRDQLGENLAAQAGVDFGDTEPVKPPPREERVPREARRSEAPPARRDRPAPERGTRPPPPGGRTTRAPSDRAMRPPRRDDRDNRDEAPPPLRERPVAGSRKHVSTLRSAESEAARKGPRKRIERTDTQDRRDRTVKVERLVSARPAPERPARRSRGPSDANPRDPNTRFPRGSDDRRGSDRRPDAREPRPTRRPDAGDGARPARRTERPESRRGEGVPAPRRHASPSALGKRERMSRSGAPTARGAAFDRDDGRVAEGRRPDAGKKVRSTRPESPPPPRSERGPARAQSKREDRRPDADKRERRPDAERGERRPAVPRSGAPKGGAARGDGRRDDKAPRPPGRAATGRPMGAASRKPSARKAGDKKPFGAGSPRSSGNRTAGRDAPARGKPPRGPSKPKR